MDSSATHICLEKDLAGLIDNNTAIVYEIGKKSFLQNFTFKEEKIRKCLLKVDSENEEMTYLIVSDNKGGLHTFNINKNEKVGKFKIHDEEIVSMRVLKKHNIIYSMDRSGILRLTDFLTGEIKSTIRLNSLSSKNKSQKNDKAAFQYFDVDESGDNIVYNKNLKIKTYSVSKNTTSTIGAHSSDINSLNYSSDSKFIISSTSKDYFLYLWHRKNTNEPLMTLQLNSLISSIQMKMVEKGVYHLFAMNKSVIYGYKIILNEIDPKQPVQPSFELTFPDKNLLQVEIISHENVNSPQNVFILYGRAINVSSIYTKTLKYSKNSKSFKDVSMAITAKSKDTETTNKGRVNINTSNVNVLNDIQMNENIEMESTDIDNENKNNNSTLAQEELVALEEVNVTDQKISLVNIIHNSIINNDNSAFEWALDQKDLNLIESTVKKMSSQLIKAFIEKITETFQSSNLFKRNLLPWLNLLFKYHLLEIVKLPSKTLSSLKNLQILIQNRTKNLERLKEVSAKLDTLIDAFSKRQETNVGKGKTNITEVDYEPLLVYNESDSEDETKKKLTGQMKKKGIKKTDEKKFKEKKKEEAEDVQIFDEEDMEENFADEDFDMDEDLLKDEEGADMDVDDENESDDIDDEDEDDY